MFLKISVLHTHFEECVYKGSLDYKAQEITARQRGGGFLVSQGGSDF